jgi:probable rRNA maturation factor
MTAIAITLDVASPLWEDAMAMVDIARRAAGEVLDPDGLGEVTIRLTDDAEMADLNGRYRGKPKPTNVLSFPALQGFPAPPGEPRRLGDIALGYETVAREAEAQGKRFGDHVSHLIVHGLLHLLGHDHETDTDAESMEGIEREILAKLGIADPYTSPAP